MNALFNHETFISPFSKLNVHGSWLKVVYTTLRGPSGAILRVQFDAAVRPVSALVFLQLARMQHISEPLELHQGEYVVEEGVQIRLSKNVLTLRHPFWLINVRSLVGAPHPGVARLNLKIQPLYAVDGDAVAPQ